MAKKAKAPSNDEAVLPKLKSVYDFMKQNNLDSIELDEPGTRIKLVRRRAAPPMQVPVPVYAAGAPPASAGGSHGVSSAVPASEPAPAGSIMIKAPMMGIFYRAASPSSPPFVKEGDQVKPGQILCMIEAMKVFNEIKADYPCTVLKVLLENGKPVKSGQDLYLVQR